MECKPPDMRFYDELKDLNAEFLHLIVEHGKSWQAPVLGLDAGSASALCRLSNSELDFIATAPGMLAGITMLPPSQRVSESRPDPHQSDERWLASARLFCIGLMTYLWQVARHDHFVAALCVGPVNGRVGDLAELSFGEIQGCADRVRSQLSVRFGAHPTFWPDLIRAARSEDPEFQALSRLAIIPLTLAEQHAADYRLATGD
ncbi:MAG: hypothetical protein OER85_07955 [Gammaproteobacteria bacterium]|nr:hypothetical protein [Gammaproteobacteria bacterium]